MSSTSIVFCRKSRLYCMRAVKSNRQKNSPWHRHQERDMHETHGVSTDENSHRSVRGLPCQSRMQLCHWWIDNNHRLGRVALESDPFLSASILHKTKIWTEQSTFHRSRRPLRMTDMTDRLINPQPTDLANCIFLLEFRRFVYFARQLHCTCQAQAINFDELMARLPKIHFPRFSVQLRRATSGW